METIRTQIKNLISLPLPVFLKMGIKNCRYSIFMRLQKEQQIDNKQKTVKFCQKTLSKSHSHTLALKICLTAPSSSTDDVLCDLSLMKPGNQ